MAQLQGEPPVVVDRTDHGLVLRIALPLVQRGEVDLVRHADDLVVTVGSYRRVLALPVLLRRHRVAGAGIEGGALHVRFEAEEIDGDR